MKPIHKRILFAVVLIAACYLWYCLGSLLIDGNDKIIWRISHELAPKSVSWMETNIGILFLVGVAFPLVTVVLRKENAKGRTEQSDDADAKKRNRGSRMAKVALTSVGMGVGYVVLRYVMSHFVFRSDRPLNFILIMGGVMALILFLSVVALAPTDRQRERLGY